MICYEFENSHFKANVIYYFDTKSKNFKILKLCITTDVIDKLISKILKISKFKNTFYTADVIYSFDEKRLKLKK